MISLTTFWEEPARGADQRLLDRRQRVGTEQRRDVGQAAEHSQQQRGRDSAPRTLPAPPPKRSSRPSLAKVRLVMRQMWWRDGSDGAGSSFMTTPAFPIRCTTRLAGLQHGGELDQLGLVLVGVMLAEQQDSARRQLRAYACGSAASIAAVSPGQLRAGQSASWRLLRTATLSSTLSDVFASGLVPRSLTGVSCLTLAPIAAVQLAVWLRPRES